MKEIFTRYKTDYHNEIIINFQDYRIKSEISNCSCIK